MLLSTGGMYVIQALVDIINHSHGKSVKIKDITQRQSLPKPYIEKLFNKLKRDGILKSVKGPSGGYLLARSPKEITVLEVLNSIGERITPKTTQDNALSDTKERGGVLKFMTNWEESTRKWLQTPLSDIAEGGIDEKPV